MSGKETPNTPRLYLSAYFMCQHPVPFVVFCLFCFFHSLSMTYISHLFSFSSSESNFYVCVCYMFVLWMLVGGGKARRRHQLRANDTPNRIRTQQCTGRNRSLRAAKYAGLNLSLPYNNFDTLTYHTLILLNLTTDSTLSTIDCIPIVTIARPALLKPNHVA